MIKLSNKKTYEGFSLVEMLITTVILGLLMLTSALVLSTLIRVSTTSTNKARVRTESEFVLEMLRRTLKTTDPSNVHLYISDSRKFDFNDGSVIDGPTFTEVLNSNQTGNEIHFKPNGSTGWICLAFYKGISTDLDYSGNVKGYILRTSKSDLADNLEAHKNCLLSDSENFVVLNSRFVNIENFTMQLKPTVEKNKVIQLDMLSSAVNWYFGNGALLNRQFQRQAIIKTETIIW